MEVDELMEKIEEATEAGKPGLVQTLCRKHKSQTQNAIRTAREQRDKAQALLDESVSPRDKEIAREIYDQADKTLQYYMDMFGSSATYVYDRIRTAIINSAGKSSS